MSCHHTFRHGNSLRYDMSPHTLTKKQSIGRHVDIHAVMPNETNFIFRVKMVRKRNRKQLQWQKPAHNKSSSQNRNNVRKENQQVHQESEPQDYYRRDLFRENVYEGKDHNKSVFEKARVKVSVVFPGCKIITCFSNITFEILHLIPRYPHVLPELVLLRTVEDDSILLGRIHRISEVNKKVYVRDINDEELCLELLCLSGITRPGRFVALKNPTLTVFHDGEFGFRTNETGSVHYIDVDGDYFNKRLCQHSSDVLYLCLCLKDFFETKDISKFCNKTNIQTTSSEKETYNNSTENVSNEQFNTSMDIESIEIGGHESHIKAKEQIMKPQSQNQKSQSTIKTAIKSEIENYQTTCSVCEERTDKKCSRCKKDKNGEETYVAFYLDYDNPFPFFSWSGIRPGRFITIDNPFIHYFMDGSVGLRIEEPSTVSIIDV
ncbi:unnamed protein product [Mytilus edulis]|uniref:Uncharacterized protein n=1 Tax=Mytilus edulis TaxID=6550 RepID=A0A8S3RD64_MYTED|nr:unnamed protein product [Mytilus edulis]